MAAARKVAILGAGKIGESSSGGCCRPAGGRRTRSSSPPGERSDRRAAERYGVPATDNAEARTRARRRSGEAQTSRCCSVTGRITPEQTVLSVAAAIPTGAIERHLSGEIPVVRAMPNAPATVHEGMAGICAGTYARDEHLQLAEEALAHLGAVVRVPERYMDAVTAVSGSGPAYFALLAEAMIEAGILLGLGREVSTQLVVQTMLGTAKLLRDEEDASGRTTRGGYVAGRHDDPGDPRTRAGRRARRVPERDPGGDGPLARTGERRVLASPAGCSGSGERGCPGRSGA